MSISKTLFGVTHAIPETDEIDWGDPLTTLLEIICSALEATLSQVGDNFLQKIDPTTSETFTAAQVLTVTKSLHVGAGTPGAVTITLATGLDGRVVRIMGTSDANTITIANSGNCILRSDVTLGLGDSILLLFIATGVSGISNKWVELSRSV